MIERKLPFNLVRGVLAWVVGLLAVPLTAVPFVAYAHYSQEGRLIALHVDRAFRGPAFEKLDRADAGYVKRHHVHYRNAVMVLNVHAVMDGADESDGTNPESSVLPVKLFAADMQMLRDAGYHTVTPEQITAWREGVFELPPNALLLTFDDGRTDTVLNAAPILKRVGMRATVFAIGDAWKRSPLYEATPEELRSLQRQGWSIEAHASAPHSGLAVDGKRLPFLSARMTVDGRLESLSQFRTRAAASTARRASRPRRSPTGPSSPSPGRSGPTARIRARTTAASPRSTSTRRARSTASASTRTASAVQAAHEGDRPDADRALRAGAHAHAPPAFDRLELAIAASAPEISHVGVGGAAHPRRPRDVRGAARSGRLRHPARAPRRRPPRSRRRVRRTRRSCSR